MMGGVDKRRRQCPPVLHFRPSLHTLAEAVPTDLVTTGLAAAAHRATWAVRSGWPRSGRWRRLQGRAGGGGARVACWVVAGAPMQPKLRDCCSFRAAGVALPGYPNPSCSVPAEPTRRVRGGGQLHEHERERHAHRPGNPGLVDDHSHSDCTRANGRAGSPSLEARQARAVFEYGSMSATRGSAAGARHPAAGGSVRRQRGARTHCRQWRTGSGLPGSCGAGSSWTQAQQR